MTDLRDQLQTSLGDAYAIQRELGGGGMSRVFVAEETSLGRRVVVKVLPEDLSGNVSIARFRREISLAARLQHPHIVPLLAAGEINGLPYYVMPFVDGESLRARIARGELPIPETISILRDVAKALAFAHGKGVTHRDIKPDNVLLAGTSAVITDFGVAKALSEATVSETGRLTSVGVALGTPAYMAPEQAAADPATDLRADIYAFGVMAYEMLAGHAPFAGRNMQSTIAAHATETPGSIAALRPATPPRLAQLVMRCLEKRPGDRPQSADEIVQVLDAIGLSSDVSASTPARARWRAAVVASVIGGVVICLLALAAWLRMRGDAAGGDEIRSIAVLPFENTSGDTAFNYLEEGLTDHVRDALNAVPGLAVKARSSSFQLKGRTTQEIRAKLRVAAVLRGTVSGSASRLHVTAELVRTSDENALWSHTFDEQPTALAAMQDTITRAISARLRLRETSASSGQTAASGARGTTNVDAYYDFLRARHASDLLDFPRATELFQRAIARDPRFARAHASLAMTYANMPTLGVLSVDSMNALARASAQRALALDSTAVEAYIADSYVLASQMHFSEALAPLEKALRTDSTNVDVLMNYGLGLAQVGRVADGLVLVRRARQRDPLSQSAAGVLSYMFEMARVYDSALVLAKIARDIDSTGALVHQGLGFISAFAGMPDSAVASFERAFKLQPTFWNGRSNLVFGYAAAGRWKEASEQRTLLARESAGNSPHYLQMIAALAFGEYDVAMRDLEQGVAAREALFGIAGLACDPLFDPLKSNPRFDALMQRIGARACPATGKWPIAARPH